MRWIRVLPSVILFASAVGAQGAPGVKRPVRVGDMYRIKNVGGLSLSPDGRWVAYTVTTTDSAKDKSDTDVWMTTWDGAQTIQVTSSPDGESDPKFSPDGRYLSFLSSRQGGKGSQLWIMDRQGGEARRLTDLKTGIRDYEWSPDAKRIALVMNDAAPDADTSNKRPKPIVLDRYHFKSDAGGYLDSTHTHIQLFDVATKKAEPLTPGLYDESSPTWSPDGRLIAFESTRVPGDVDHSRNSDVFVVEARAGASPRKLTTFEGPDTGPFAWSPDGSLLAYLQGSEAKYTAYNEDRLAVVPVAGGAPRVLTESFDRPVSSPHFSADGKSIVFLFTDDRARYVGRIPVAGGAVEKLVDGRRVIGSYEMTKDGHIAVINGTATQPNEVFALENGGLRQLSRQNDAWLTEVQLATTEDVSFKARDGNEPHGLLVKPIGYVQGQKYPLLLRIHGGPNGQDQHSFSLERELFAANGYAVLNVNYRGSNGRGEKYQNAIFADWGNKEVTDLLAGVDAVIAMGIADPNRLGIGGWSYGGILTDYTIATTNRFKAAIAGAGSALQLSMYGSDQYIYQYENELGPPWKAQDLWIKLSYPFFHADRITTPTLFMGGDKDFNVPVIGGEQMYQALRSLGVPAEMIIYPNQHHGLSLPSFNYDRLQRYVAWYDRFLKGTTTVQAGSAKP
ncbi:MAG TPA: S9 family peptidase [Gemmatimonadaceae bacterium]|jgi:dipeptidyl aminopeptidase/acylaminoacyl peptidase|nr:S9 family peptidase [Gemmatimonadaceae bacterium]